MKHTVSAIAFFISAAILPALAHAHGGGHGAVEPWDSRPLIAGNLLALSLLYIAGWFRVKKHTEQTSSLRLFSFFLSILLLAVALVSPVARVSEELAWVHMIQHSLLMMAAAPLFIMGSPAFVFFWALPRSTRRMAARLKNRYSTFVRPLTWFAQPLLAWLLYALAIWIWHVPALYEAALTSPITHDLQHLTFFIVSCLFWKVFLHPLQTRRVHPGASVLYLFLASLHTIALGIFMALSPVVWYSPYRESPIAYGLDPLHDQQIAGFIMWMPACMMYLAIAVALLVIWLRQAEPGSGYVEQVA